MGWGNSLRDGEMVRLKRHALELRKRDARIAELEAHVAQLTALAPHANACQYQRGGTCTCGIADQPHSGALPP